MLSPVKVSPLVSQIHPDALGIFKDSYMVEFLDLTQGHAKNQISPRNVGFEYLGLLGYGAKKPRLTQPT